MKKFVRLTAFMVSALSLAFIVSCGDDDDADAGPSVEGSYTFTSAVMASDGPLDGSGNVIVDPTTGNPILPTGANVTDQVNAAILGGAVDENDNPLCSNPADTRVTLAAGGDLLYTCSGGTESIENGSWDLLSDTELRLVINFEGVGAIPVDISELVVTETGLTGNIANLPLPGEVVGLPIPLITLDLDVILARD